MGIIEILLLAVALSMDAFAVAICKGLSLKHVKVKQSLIVGLWFGGFQALMPFLGYLIGAALRLFVDTFVPWIAFVLLVLIGANMLREALSKEEEDGCGCTESEVQAQSGLAPMAMFTVAVATSIDALAAGFSLLTLPTFSFVMVAVAIIGVVTCLLSAGGVYVGHLFGAKHQKMAEVSGGVILILLGLKIIIEHLFFK